MADPAIIEATYTEWKMVKTRSALILCFEVPLEYQAYVQGALGTPLPDQSIHVAIARLMPGAKPMVEIDKPGRVGSLARAAGILCNEGGFWQFLAEKGDYQASSSGEAASYVRLICGVTSRAELDTNEDAGRKWRDLKTDYDIWLKDAA